jgi:hypothetical protein
LGEFSPNVLLLFALGTYVKTTEVAHIFGLLNSTVKVYALILTKPGLGYILGEFFTNSSGHPVAVAKLMVGLTVLRACHE